jgi:hypothetical protein
MDLIDKNKKAALERRAQLHAEAREDSQQHIFEGMQWL